MGERKVRATEAFQESFFSLDVTLVPVAGKEVVKDSRRIPSRQAGTPTMHSKLARSLLLLCIVRLGKLILWVEFFVFFFLCSTTVRPFSAAVD